MITFKKVYRTFDPDESGVKNISFSVEPGELVMVTGHSGSGKTTIMRLLTKEYVPNEGEIHFEGTDLSKIKRSQLHTHRRRIGVVFQDYRLIPDMNIWENIALPLAIAGKKQSEIEERVTDLLNLVKLSEKAYLFPSQLSGGEAQRISIARALANAPSVIFADEPTGNLDQDTSQAIAHLLKQINELGTTLIFATHDPKVLSIFADARHIHLKDGEIEFDTAEDTKRKPAKTVKKTEIEKDKEPFTQAEKTSDTTQDTDLKEKISKELEALETEKETSPVEKKPGFLSRLFGKKPANDRSDDSTEEDTFEVEIELIETDQGEDSREPDSKKNKASEKNKATPKEEPEDKEKAPSEEKTTIKSSSKTKSSKKKTTESEK
ncbi:MAG: ATP-binding cassette domain-containing protein [Pseudomonadales bacterium]|nr:ATP-binding cassette domain-containing protein [Candidatus Woesebacteria bacterium]MCB9800953.1 ATP-binding cassette domain-containing protein [Pseudomonadales bacterium]